ncbi:MAG: hypothetical protein J7J16_03130 [Deltaproteobacteria bacterium]|nr:hypothetical protein [Deltaproteobacteria bacterium]
MSREKSLCAICAWREVCKKRFLYKGIVLNCPDFVRDVTIKEEKEDNEDATEDKRTAP